MNPNTKNGNNVPKQSPAQKLEVLRRLRDNDHRLRSNDRPYDQDWFLGTVLDQGLEHKYMEEVATSNWV